MNILKTHFSSTKTTYFPLGRRPTYQLKVSFGSNESDILNQCDFDRLKTALYKQKAATHYNIINIYKEFDYF